MSRADLPPDVRAFVSEVVEASGLDLPDRHDVERELEAHFEDGLEAGVAADELMRRFGDPASAAVTIARARERRARRNRATRGGGEMGFREWWEELVKSGRSLTRSPGFSVLVVLTLALGVGANTAVFSVIDSVLLAPLPYQQPERLVRIYEVQEESRLSFNFVRSPTVAAMLQWDDVFDGVGSLYTYRQTGADLTDGDQPVRVTLLSVSAGYFETLGVHPRLGRTFRPEESIGPGAPGGPDPLATVVIISDELWRDHYGADPAIVGRAVEIDGSSFEVVGVMPAGFEDPFGPRADMWRPQDLREGGFNNWGNFYLSAVARLPEGTTLAAAQERASARFARAREAAGVPDQGWGPVLVPLHGDIVGDTRRSMLLLLAGAAALVLLSACVNVANLMFVRGLGRIRDAALRSALGSGRLRLLARTLTEGGILAAAGALAGVALGWLGVRALVAIAPDALPAGFEPTLSLRVFVFALAASGVALLTFALAPAIRFASTAPADVLRQGQRGSTGGGRLGRLRDALVIVQVGAGLILLTGAGLLTRSFAALQDVPLGIEPDGVFTFEVHLPTSRYPDGEARRAVQDQLHQRIASLPGVEAAGATSWLPVNGTYHSWGVRYLPPGESETEGGAWYQTNIRVVNGDYFEAMGIDVLRGPSLNVLEPDGENVVWISEALAEVFGDRDPIGEIVSVGNADRRVLGIVEDVPLDTRGDMARKIYIPHAQFAGNRNWALIHTVATRSDFSALREDVRRVLAEIDPQLVLYQPKPYTDVLAAGRARDRFATVLMGAFAALSLILTLVGTYGVLSHAVAGRRREIGIRMALGADGSSVRGMVMKYAAALAVPGVIVGVVGAWYGSRWVESLLFEVDGLDPLVYATTVSLVLGACLIAGFIPARRATRVDPARTLTEE